MPPCPKCGYQRKPTDTAPDWQCARCGVAYTKYKPPSQDVAASAESDVSPIVATELDNIKEFQRRLRAFFPRFFATVLFGVGPAVALVMLADKFPRLHFAIIGFVIGVFAFARALYLWYRYVRCPACGTLLSELWGLQLPHHECPECGVRLSRGARLMD